MHCGPAAAAPKQHGTTKTKTISQPCQRRDERNTHPAGIQQEISVQKQPCNTAPRSKNCLLRPLHRRATTGRQTTSHESSSHSETRSNCSACSWSCTTRQGRLHCQPHCPPAGMLHRNTRRHWSQQPCLARSRLFTREWQPAAPPKPPRRRAAPWALLAGSAATNAGLTAAI